MNYCRQSMRFFITLLLCQCFALVAWGELHSGTVACSVCRHAVEELWHYGDQTRKYCLSSENETRTDDECQLSALATTALISKVGRVCTDMAYKYAVHENNHHLEPKDHDDALEAAKIAATCEKWLQYDHGDEKLSLYISINVNARKDPHAVLPRLQHRFCQSACNLGKIPDRRKRHAPVHQERHTDFSHAHAIEQAALNSPQDPDEL